MIRCGVFLRQSEADDELAVSRQWDEILAKICIPRGWEPVRYCDNDSTALGAKRKLPDRDRMLRDAEAGELQAIAVWDLDRLYREPIDLEYIIPLADKKGILLATVTGEVDLSTDNGRLFARIKGAVAKAESERKSARQIAKSKQLAESGENWTSRRPFGRYKGGELHPTEALELAAAYELVLSAHSLYSIIADWNERGITTTLGNRWRNSNQLTMILKNPRNASLKSYHREILGEADWPPIVTRDVWQAVNDLLSDPKRRPKDVARKHLLSSLALCGECARQGNRMTVKTFRLNDVKNTPVYRCRECFRCSQYMEPVDEHITNLVVGRLSQPDAAELLIDQRHPDLDAKRNEAAALRQRLKSLAVDFAEGDLEPEQLREATTRIRAKLRAVEAVVEDANRARLFRGVVGEDAILFPGLHPDRRRAIIRTFLSITLMQQSLKHEAFDPDTSLSVDWLALSDRPQEH